LSKEERIKHQIYAEDQRFADMSKQFWLTDRQRRDLELNHLREKSKLIGRQVDDLEANPVAGGYGTQPKGKLYSVPDDISEQAKAYNEKLLPALRERQQIENRISELENEGTFGGRLSKQLGDAAASAMDLSSRLADTFSSAIMTGIDGLAAGITGLIDGTRSWGQVMQQVGSQILGMFVQMIVRAVALFALVKLLGIIPGFGPALAGFAGLGSGHASGGPIGPGLYPVGEQGTEYVVNNPTLARFGTGFFDSLQRGGSVPASAPSGGGGAPVTIAFFGSKSEAQRDLDSTDGEGHVVDIVSRNIHRFRS